jgi:hypothetical protein
VLRGVSLLVCLHFSPSTSVSPVSIIPPMLHTHLNLHVALSRRTNGRSLVRTFQKHWTEQVSRSKCNRQRGPRNAAAPLQFGTQSVRSGPAGLAINRPSAETQTVAQPHFRNIINITKGEFQRDWREVRTVQATRGATDHHSQRQTKTIYAMKPMSFGSFGHSCAGMLLL